MNIERLNYFVKPYPFLALMAGVLVAIGLMSARTYKKFITQDPLPTVVPIVAPNDKPIIKTRLYLKEFLVLHMTENDFLSDVFVEFEYNPEQISHEIIDQFVFSKADIQTKQLISKNTERNKEIARYYVRLKFSSNLSHREFPLGDHKIIFLLTNYALSADKAVFVSDNADFRIDEGINTAGWDYVGKSVKAGIRNFAWDDSTHQTMSIPRVAYVIDFDRANVLEILMIVMPMLLIFLLMLLALILDANSHFKEIIALANGGILAIVVHRFTIRDISPKVPYFVLGDYLFTLIFALGFLCVILAFLRKSIDRYLGFFILAIYALFLLGWFYFTQLWIH